MLKLGLILGSVLLAVSTAKGNPALEPAAVEFFETKIRPVLADSCYSCHSQKEGKTKGSLALDTKEGLLKGGDAGPSLVPGDPDKSLLIKAIRYTDENLQMPPKGKKLSPEQIANFEAWVKMGAPDPRTTQTLPNPSTNHWAFRKPLPQKIPAVKTPALTKTSIDNFIQARLESVGLKPSPRADRRTLIRRATLDLTGLPPTPDEVDAFVKDTSPDAYEKLIDRLLASPRYGERWARHWLDVARYADTKGYVFEEERRFPYSYTYRDYVIRAFNEDLPYDKFIIEQIAADLLPLGEDKRSLAAMGFLTLGRRFLNNQPDIIDDRIDVVTRGTMGLTVVCARCHDHKYDPIPIKDYYSLYGVFASSSEPSDKPVLGTKSLPKEYDSYLKDREKREEELKKYREEKSAEAMAKIRGQFADYLLAAYDVSQLSDKSKEESLVRERKLNPELMRRFKSHLEKQNKEHPVLGPWIAVSSLSSNDWPAKAHEALIQVKSSGKLNPLISATLEKLPANAKELSEAYAQTLKTAEKSWQELLKKSPDSKSLPDETAEQIRNVLYAGGPFADVNIGELRRIFDTPVQQKLRALQRQIDELDATHAGAPPKAMALKDNDRPTNPRVFIRGNPGNQGPEVPRQFLEVLAGPQRQPFTNGSGRLEMALSIANTNNPLTARVFVNRVWLHLMGQPLVKTPSDFGLRSEPPTHPELLDHLAIKFMEEGWSMKKLQREILLSHTYQQSSLETAAGEKADPANNLLWRMNRKRLEFEPMRDSILAVSGRLDLTEGGKPVEITKTDYSPRRTIYGFVERQNLPAIFRTFDFANPDSTSPQRFSTTVPQQALFMLNSPFVINEAKSLAKRSTKSDPANTIRNLYKNLYQREPTKEEQRLGQLFLAKAETLPAPEPTAPVWQYGYGKLSADASKIESFTKFPHYTGSAWQQGKDLPDPKIGWAMLNAAGGHPGTSDKYNVIRRWVAPHKATYTIRGTLAHETREGDGVRGQVISSKQGRLGEWVAYNKKETTELKDVSLEAGEVLDFVVDCRTGIGFDSFNWAPKIKVAAPTKEFAKTEWDATKDFAGPPAETKPLSPVERYAQALLLSNEFVFVD